MPCVHLTSGLHCPESRDIPFVVGIGPAKSGSTAVFRTLASHPQIELGNAGLRGDCCGTELYFFLRPLERRSFNASWERLAEYFKSRLEPLRADSILWWGEKTPRYAGHTLVPFFLRAMLPAARLVYTSRDSIELDASLYAFRGMKQRMTHMTWAQGRVAAHTDWRECRARELLQRNLSEDGLYGGELGIDAVEKVEASLHARCKQGQFRANGTIDAFKEVLNGWNLRRWSFVFPRSQLLCVSMSDHLSNWKDVSARLGRFLGLRDSLFRNTASAREQALPPHRAGATDDSMAFIASAVATDAHNLGWVERLCARPSTV